VTGAKLLNIQKEYNTAKLELDKLYLSKAKMDNQLLALKPDLEYLKLLESRMVAIKLKKSAIDADVHFEQYGNEIAVFKRNSIGQITIFSFLIIGFALFLIQICIFLCDDHIYDEHNLQKCYDDLPVIGYSPRFD
jgi:hypothetical protein